MFCVGCVIVIDMEGKMDFIISQIVGAVHVTHPGQFQLVRCCAVSQVYKPETSVRAVFCTDNFKSESFFVEVQSFFQIIYIQIIVCKCKFHILLPS